MGTFPTKPQRNGQFKALSSPQAHEPQAQGSQAALFLLVAERLARLAHSPTTPRELGQSQAPPPLQFDGRRWGGGERRFLPTGPRPGPETPVLKAELGLQRVAPSQPIYHLALGGTGQSLSNACRSTRLDPARLSPRSHPHPGGSAPRHGHLLAPPDPNSSL